MSRLETPCEVISFYRRWWLYNVMLVRAQPKINQLLDDFFSGRDMEEDDETA